jgi:RNA polymerase sigma factor (sigma-70 family)
MAAEQLGGLSDRQLLERLLACPDEAAFEAVVRRHGPMVYRVCWRVLQQAEDPEDAFQATFLLLARKLSAVTRRDSLASWLHGAAHRVALNARRQAARRRRHERQVAASRPAPPDDLPWREVRTALDEELARLPEKLRAPLVLCYLEGRTQEAAAGELGCSRSTLLRRLEEGRSALGRRLARRGLALPGALAALLVSDCAARAALPASLIGPTAEAAACVAALPAATATAVAANVAALTEGVLKAMFLRKLKCALAVLAPAALLAAVTCFALLPGVAAEPPDTREARTTPPGVPGPPRPVVVREDAQVQKVVWSADGKVVATICTRYEVGESNDSKGGKVKFLSPRSTVKLWDAKTGKLARSLGEEKDTYIRAFATSPDGKHAAVAGSVVGRRQSALFVRILDAKTWAVRHKIDDLPAPVYALAFSPDGKTLAMGGNGPTKTGTFVNLWDVPGEKMRVEAKFAAPAYVVAAVPEWYLTAIAFSPDGRLLAAGEGNRRGQRPRVQLYDVQSGAAIRAVDVGKSKGHFGAAFTPDGKSLMSCCGSVKFWDPQTGKEQRAFDVKGWIAWDVAPSPDGRLLAVGVSREVMGKWSNAVILCDARTGKEKRTVHPETSALWLRSLAFSPDGKSLAVGGATDADIRVKDGDKTKGELRIDPIGR